MRKARVHHAAVAPEKRHNETSNMQVYRQLYRSRDDTLISSISLYQYGVKWSASFDLGTWLYLKVLPWTSASKCILLAFSRLVLLRVILWNHILAHPNTHTYMFSLDRCYMQWLRNGISTTREHDPPQLLPFFLLFRLISTLINICSYIGDLHATLFYASTYITPILSLPRQFHDHLRQISTWLDRLSAMRRRWVTTHPQTCVELTSTALHPGHWRDSVSRWAHTRCASWHD